MKTRWFLLPFEVVWFLVELVMFVAVFLVWLAWAGLDCLKDWIVEAWK